MLLEDPFYVVLLAAFMIGLIYYAASTRRDGALVSWENILYTGVSSIFAMCVPMIFNFVLGECGNASLLDLLRLKPMNDILCSTTVGWAYGGFVITIALALWNGVVLVYRIMK